MCFDFYASENRTKGGKEYWWTDPYILNEKEFEVEIKSQTLLTYVFKTSGMFLEKYSTDIPRIKKKFIFNQMHCVMVGKDI